MDLIEGIESLHSLGSCCWQSKNKPGGYLKGVVSLDWMVVTKLVDNGGPLSQYAPLTSNLIEQILPKFASVRSLVQDRKG